jgi:hypothetical protein
MTLNGRDEVVEGPTRNPLDSSKRSATTKKSVRRMVLDKLRNEMRLIRMEMDRIVSLLTTFHY